MNINRWLLSTGIAVFICGCAPITFVGLKFLYLKSELPSDRIINDLCYIANEACDESHKLDLYLPQGKNWPVVIFVHGGGWDEGDKQLRVAGADVYSNIGRFYANQGMGVAVINYRLQPEADWRGQIEDVTMAMKWVSQNIQKYGGQTDRVFVMGHSAGTYLAAFAALTLTPDDKTPIRGVIAVSGAALDLGDQRTYDLGANIQYYENRFRGNNSSEEWQKLASPVYFVNRNAPPFLILYAGGETKSLQRQSQRLKQALEENKIENKLVVVPGESHTRIVLTLSRPDKTAGPEILSFIQKHQ